MSRMRIAGKGIAAAFLCSLAVGCISQKDHDAMKADYDNQIELLKKTITGLENDNAKLTQKCTYAEGTGVAAQREADALKGDNDLLKKQIEELNKKMVSLVPEHGEIFEMNNGVLSMKGDASFDAGLATLRPKAKAALDALAKELMAIPGVQIRVDGHTDNDPIAKTKYKWTTGSNFELAAARALTVLLYFEQQGIPGSQMYMTSYGEHHPRVPNDTKENKAKNRRVEIRVGQGPMKTPMDGGAPSKTERKDHPSHPDHK